MTKTLEDEGDGSELSVNLNSKVEPISTGNPSTSLGTLNVASNVSVLGPVSLKANVLT